MINKLFNVFRGQSSQSTVTINGQTYSGNNVSIVNDLVFVDGVAQGQTLVGPITVTVNGDVQQLETVSGDIEVHGNVGTLSTTSGDVDVSLDVKGGVTTVSGDVEVAGSVAGDINTVSGDISR
jgi:DUF4097 and DUF4098 domain-containing protein YvlB